MRPIRLLGRFLAVAIAGMATPAGADWGETLAKLTALKVAFPEAHRGGKMTLGAVAETLSQLSAEADPAGEGFKFTAAEGAENVMIDVPASEEPESIARLIREAGLEAGGSAVKVPPGTEPEDVSKLLEQAAGTVVLRPHAVRSMLGQELTGRLHSVVVPKLQLEDTGAMAALGYLSRLYAEAAPDTEPLKFVEEPGSGAGERRFTIALTNIPLDEALKYIIDLCGLTLRYDRDESVIVVGTAKQGR
jgi:hypothetical protein